MCDVCAEFSQLLVNCEARLTDDVSQYPTISQSELETVLNYIISWPQRQCMCCYRNVKNFERFYLVVQSILCLSVCQLKQLKDDLLEAAKSSKSPDTLNDKSVESEANSPPDNEQNEKSIQQEPNIQPPEPEPQPQPSTSKDEITPKTSDSNEDPEVWPMQQKEKLMHIVSKIFLLNFPLYLACKHSSLSRLEDLSAQEISNLSSYCDLHDTEIPAYLLRNVSLFCKLGGVCAMTSVFENAAPTTLPLSMAHAIVAAVGNLKLWLNFRAVAQLFMPLRSKILKYMCSLEDKDLRVPAVKSMADFMWGAAKEPCMDSGFTFDIDGLSLAFKYFNSSTLTMRLAGVAQINALIAAHNELCAGEQTSEVEVAGNHMATWLVFNNIIEHLFGPNLHVEVIKQSHMILKFLAVEMKIFNEHIELVWAAAQLKHCGRQVYDLLPGFIRALAPKPCAHLYSLLCALPPKEHTEQSLYLASALTRALWARWTGSVPSPLADPRRAPPPCKPHHNSSSEASVSMEQTNSDDDPCEELSTSGEETGPTPRKQSKHQRELTAEQDWFRDGEELSKKDCASLKSCQKRVKRAGSSGSGSSGAEEMLRPRKKKLYKKRHKPTKTRHLPTQIKAAELAESVSEVEEESSGSETAHCQLLCDNVDASRRHMELRLLQYKRRSEEEGSASSALSVHEHAHDHAHEHEHAHDHAHDHDHDHDLPAPHTHQGLVGRGGSPGGLPAHVDDVCKPGNTLLWDLLQDPHIEQLGEGLALEAEKALCALLCFSTDKFIRIKFIEGCLDNLANHRSVAVSLRLLPKLFSSFQQLRGMDMHQVVMWAERERGMLRLFVEDLRHYMRSPRSTRSEAGRYAHVTELTVRLHFLTAVFSSVGSPHHFRLTVEQVEELWQCLVSGGSAESADCLYSWLLSHTKSPEQHALGLDALRFLYVDKMPTLDPESISIMGLSLYQQLCNLARMALGTGDGRDTQHPHTLAMDHLWKIALRANSTDVSMSAIQYLNSYYMGQQLQQEDDFVAKCMFHLSSAAERLISKEQNVESSGSQTVPPGERGQEQEKKDSDKATDKQNIYEHMTEEAALQCIQRALLLLKTHLDTFKRRYAYHLRRWALAETGQWQGSGGAGCVRLCVQPGGCGPRAALTLPHTDLVAHLRAHVHVWWDTQIQGEEGVTALATDGPLRIITQGQELTIDYDERTLYDMGFKDNQLVFVSVGVGGRSAWAEWPSAQPPPSRARLPTVLLLDRTCFHQLFTLMQALGQMKEPGPNGEPIAHTKAQLLSRRVWDILQAVPLNPTLLEAFQNPVEGKISELLDPTSPQKLMYSLHIIDKLSSTTTGTSKEGTSTEKTEEVKTAENWNELFIKKGGLRLMYDIMMSGVLQRSDDSEWRQDCLALLLQLICRIGTHPTTDPAQTPKLHPALLTLMNAEDTMDRLITILCEAAAVKEPVTYKTGFWGRAQVVQHCMRLCVWWARGGGEPSALAWALRQAAPRLLLDDADPAVRREAGSALYRLCGGELSAAAPLLGLLAKHLPRAAEMRPHPRHHDVVHHQHAEEGKEPYGPACRDYFWLLCRLIDGLPGDIFKDGAASEYSGMPDLNELCEQIRVSLDTREIIEKRGDLCTVDDGLYGQLSLLTHLIKHPLRFNTAERGKQTIEMVFGFLFDVPNPDNRNLPKCKSQKSRAAAYDLLVELVRGAPDNYMVLYERLMEHHKPAGAQCSYPWDYWPAEESRAECGYVGLANLGATCYMAACMQHLYMMRGLRACVLAACPRRSRHAPVLTELQRMFASLAVSIHLHYITLYTVHMMRGLRACVLAACPRRSRHAPVLTELQRMFASLAVSIHLHYITIYTVHMMRGLRACVLAACPRRSRHAPVLTELQRMFASLAVSIHLHYITIYTVHMMRGLRACVLAACPRRSRHAPVLTELQRMFASLAVSIHLHYITIYTVHMMRGLRACVLAACPRRSRHAPVLTELQRMFASLAVSIHLHYITIYTVHMMRGLRACVLAACPRRSRHAPVLTELQRMFASLAVSIHLHYITIYTVHMMRGLRACVLAACPRRSRHAPVLTELQRMFASLAVSIHLHYITIYTVHMMRGLRACVLAACPRRSRHAPVLTELQRMFASLAVSIHLHYITIYTVHMMRGLRACVLAACPRRSRHAPVLTELQRMFASLAVSIHLHYITIYTVHMMRGLRACVLAACPRRSRHAPVLTELQRMFASLAVSIHLHYITIYTVHMMRGLRACVLAACPRRSRHAPVLTELQRMFASLAVSIHLHYITIYTVHMMRGLRACVLAACPRRSRHAPVLTELQRMFASLAVSIHLHYITIYTVHMMRGLRACVLAACPRRSRHAPVLTELQRMFASLAVSIHLHYITIYTVHMMRGLRACVLAACPRRSRHAPVLTELQRMFASLAVSIHLHYITIYTVHMMRGLRACVLAACPRRSRHAPVLTELQRMFASLAESERKAYNPRSFCKVYQMDHQPLNTGEQKDMAEFFIDLVSKLEEMTPELKKLVKTLFCGVLSNNVVSLDCPHVSRTLEEFYTVRCQVADMRNLHQSLDEVTVKDTLEGDNCYTCSQCAAKVRAEKRACFKKLPRILCFNTMRYTFNMLTMLKEKVNTHFSFPMKLDMSGYVEKHLMPAQYQEEKKKSAEQKTDGEASPDADNEESDEEECYEYELIGVTVHTGTADGGHYYSFIKSRENNRWLLFNDAEVKPFDPVHIAAECFGGEMTSKTYDSVTDKFMDFSFEKTNSAYMLFYELSPPQNRRNNDATQQEEAQSSTAEESSPLSVERRSSGSSPTISIPEDLLKWIWEDNMQFLHDKNIFQHAYFTFMGQMCGSVPQSLPTLRPEVTEVAARLSTSFFIETFIHAKEKPTMVSWVELVTKQFNSSAAASEWFLGHMADDTWWPMQVLIKCPNQMVRQMFQRLCMHVIQRLRSSHCALYLQDVEFGDNSKLGEASCVTRFIRMLLSLMESGARSHLRHLTEYFSLLYEFSKMGEEEGQFLLKINAISTIINFYLGQSNTVPVECSEESGSVAGGAAESGGDKLRSGALDKMVALVGGLVERSRDPAGHMDLAPSDALPLLHDKSFPFIYQQTRDCLNLQQTRTLIFALCRWNEPLAQKIVAMIFQAIAKNPESCGPFFKLLTLLVEGSGGGAGAGGALPCFTALTLARLWDAWDACPHAALEWLALQVPRNKAAHAWALRGADRWLEPQLLGAAAARTRAAAALLLVALVPSHHFRAGYARARPHPPQSHLAKLPDTAHHTLHQVYTMLLGKLKAARKYTDIAIHGTMKLTAYFGVMSYCVVSRVEKLMFGQYFNDLWELYHPGISEPSVAVHPNKQALLTFWHAVSVDCPENIQLMVSHQRLIKHIAFNYILADHEDGEVVSYNRAMLPPYYALLRLCCRRSSSFARALAQHQNIHWAFRNIAPHAHLYPAAADELLRLARILAARGGNNGNNGNGSNSNSGSNNSSSGSEAPDGREAAAFRRSTLSAYLQGLNGRTCWTTLISAFCTLVENEDDRLYVVYNGGLQMTFEALHSLHAVYAEGGAGGGGAGGVRAELGAALRWARALLRTLRTRRQGKEARALLLACKDWPECARRLLTMLSLPQRLSHLRDAALGVLREIVLIGGAAALGALVPLAAGAHAAARGARRPALTPSHPPAYKPYHKFIDTCWSMGVSARCASAALVSAAALCALEAAPHADSWFAARASQAARAAAQPHAHPADVKLEEMIAECSVVGEYVNCLLLDERESLEDPVIYEFLQHYYPKVCGVDTGGAGGAASAADALAEELRRGDSCGGGYLGRARALLLLAARARSPPPGLAAAAAAIAVAAEEESSEPEAPPEPPVEPPACHTPEGSEGEECAEGGGGADSDSDPAPPAPRPRPALRAALSEVSRALLDLITHDH